jgi:hypothetical protein
MNGDEASPRLAAPGDRVAPPCVRYGLPSLALRQRRLRPRIQDCRADIHSRARPGCRQVRVFIQTRRTISRAARPVLRLGCKGQANGLRNRRGSRN